VPRNLIGLIKASGGAGTTGQTFRNNVKPFINMDGKSMTSYLVTGISFSGGIPAGPGELDPPYSSGVVFNVTADIIRGGNAFEIQSLVQSAWLLTLLSVSGESAGMGAGFSSFSQTDVGGKFELGMQITAPLAGNPAPSINVQPNFSMPVAYGDLWAGSYVPVVTSTASGNSVLELIVEYFPDPHFNLRVDNKNGFGQGWRFTISNRNWTTADLVFRAWSVEAGADANDNNGRLAGGGPWNWISYGSSHPDNVNVPIWWRWSQDGGISWSAKQGPVAPNDTRLPT
jgi:hypothetical protein